MRKIFSIVLSIVVTLMLAAGCGQASEEELWATNNKQRVDSFFEKYKRGDIDTLKEKAIEFLQDFKTVQFANGDNAEQILDGWTRNESEIGGTTYVDYTKDVVLFNQGCEASATYNEYTPEEGTSKKTVYISLEFNSGSAQTDFRIGQILFDAMSELYGDATEIYGERLGDPISEAELRRLFTAGEPTEWSAHWDECIVSYYYSNILSESSHLNIY